MATPMETATTSKTVTLACNGREFTVDADVARMSKMIKNLMDDCPGLDVPIPIDNMDASLLADCLRYCEYHHDHDDPDAPPAKLKKSSLKLFVFSNWDEAFLPTKPRPLIHLIKAADYLDIPPLYKLTTQACARLFVGKTSAEIREAFEMADDLSVEEKIQLEAENCWADEY